MLTSGSLLWGSSSRANHTAAASLLTLLQAILHKNCNFSRRKQEKKTHAVLRVDCYWQPSGKRRKKRKTKPILRLDCHRQPRKMVVITALPLAILYFVELLLTRFIHEITFLVAMFAVLGCVKMLESVFFF